MRIKTIGWKEVGLVLGFNDEKINIAKDLSYIIVNQKSEIIVSEYQIWNRLLIHITGRTLDIQQA